MNLNTIAAKTDSILGQLEAIQQDFPSLKRHLSRWEANILARQAQLLASENKHKMAIKVCTKVIDQAAYIDDHALLSRVLFYRGSAQGNTHEFKKAADDFKIAVHLDANNSEAKYGLRKCLELIRERESIQYAPANVHDFFKKALIEEESCAKLEQRRQEKAARKQQRREARRDARLQ